MSEAAQKLIAAGQAVSTAVMILRMELPTMEAFLREGRAIENFGHIVDPTLYRDSERRAASSVVTPLFEAAVAFVNAHDDQIARSRAALERVKGRR